ncbi:phospho-N-acetylmuramoyl-pentapeptide-transferase [Candidatus Nanosyncoccus alces]|uniref:Phospho-N-acetylmuramoyl-pentapeptide-transferase n=1 Tax=Candidatus Nanosyncoccus alces TaxID=2171997 RepID=A0ABY0FLN3_9BACT|nr:phospho-N-acetylmuramoyl-pentapeptide-transferase [Candidatus Nanosyncoccus alces]RYC74570.1 Phospho-N-acetylmuramoyl-pentapeptide-transferase [Candidatus Nanosyncoccus alces]
MGEINEEVFYGLLLALAGFLFSMFLTPLYTHFAYKYKFWKKQKRTTVDGKDLPIMTKLHAHKFKRVFPTMAGLVGVIAVTAVTWIFNLDRGQTWLPLVGFLGGALVGAIDDAINIFGSGRGAAGLRGPVKFFLISVVGLTLGWFFTFKLGWTDILVPFIGDFEVGAIWVMLIFAFAVVATSNAVNITDGLDGLSGGLAMMAYGAYGVIALFQGNILLFGFCLTVVGWLLSYIWFNVPPARFMMGDTGSFALGAGLGVVSMMTNSFLLLPIIGLPLVVETGSSLIQLISKKFFGKKVFISAPLHHHLEARGWGEAKIVMRFWIVAGVCAILGIFIAATGGAI